MNWTRVTVLLLLFGSSCLAQIVTRDGSARLSSENRKKTIVSLIAAPEIPASLSATPTVSANYWFVFYNADQLSAAEGKSPDDVCSELPSQKDKYTSAFMFQDPFFNRTTAFTEGDLLTLVLVLCGNNLTRPAYDVSYNFTLFEFDAYRNFSEANPMAIAATFFVVWTLLSIAFAVHLFLRRQYITGLHLAIWMWPIMLMLAQLFTIFGTKEARFTAASTWLIFLAEWTLFIIVMLISNGCDVTQRRLSRNGYISTIVTTGLLLITGVISLYKGRYWFIPYGIVLLVDLAVILWRTVVSRRALQAMIRKSGERFANPEGSGMWNAPLKAQELAYKRFYFAIITYILAILVLAIVTIVAAVTGHLWVWVPGLVIQLVYVAFFLWLGFTFRLRDTKEYAVFEDEVLPSA